MVYIHAIQYSLTALLEVLSFLLLLLSRNSYLIAGKFMKHFLLYTIVLFFVLFHHLGHNSYDGMKLIILYNKWADKIIFNSNG